MQTINLDVSGVITFWTAGGSTRNRVRPLEDLWSPPVREPQKVAHKAAQSLCRAHGLHHLVQDTAGEGVEVVAVDRRATGNTYTQEHYISCTESYGQLFSLAEVIEAVQAEAAHVDAGDVGAALVSFARELLSVSLRPRGGIYWIPMGCVDRWVQLTTRVEECTDAQVFFGRWEASPSSVRAVSERATSEITTEVDAIMAELQDGKPHQPQFYTARKERAAKLREKLNAIQSSLGVSLQEADDALEAADTALVLFSLS